LALWLWAWSSDWPSSAAEWRQATGEWKVFLVFWPGIPLKSLRLGEFGFGSARRGYQIVSASAAKSN